MLYNWLLKSVCLCSGNFIGSLWKSLWKKVAFKVQLISKFVFSFINVTKNIFITFWDGFSEIFLGTLPVPTVLLKLMKKTQLDHFTLVQFSLHRWLSWWEMNIPAHLQIIQILLWLLNSRGANLEMVPDLESFWLYQLSNRSYLQVCCQRYRESSAFTQKGSWSTCFYKQNML